MVKNHKRYVDRRGIPATFKALDEIKGLVLISTM